MKLTLKSPLKTFVIVQPFGVNGDYYQANGINIKGHNGIDLYAPHGTPIYAAHDGYAYYEWDISQGEGVVVRSKEQFELLDGTTSYIKTVYWHMVDATKEPQYKSPITVTNLNVQGQEVKAGDLLGYADSTGFSTGSHLHFALKPVLEGEQPGTYYNPLQNNGYAGAIDPTPYMEGQSASYKFNVDMKYGETSDDVKQLQKRLGVIQTGYYGDLTRAAVIKYQDANKIALTFAQRFWPWSSVVGPKTRASLNT